MAFIDLQVELGQTNSLLKRIAEALERAVPIPRLPRGIQVRGIDSVHSYSDSAQWEREQVGALVPEGLSDEERSEYLENINDLPEDLKQLIRSGINS